MCVSLVFSLSLISFLIYNRSCKSIKPSGGHDKIKIQFYANSIILAEMLNGLHYLIYNGFQSEALKAIDIIAQKADDELFCDVILVRIASF